MLENWGWGVIRAEAGGAGRSSTCGGGGLGLALLDVDLHPVFPAETSKAAMCHGVQYEQ